jgi:hypothetical protein
MNKTSTQNRVTKGVPTGGEFAATAHSDNVPSLAGPTSPKVSSKGRTTYVTLPDGRVASRSSKTKEYTHAVVQSPEVPELVIADREATIRRAEESIAAREEALKDPKFTKRQRFRDDRDPDLDHKGEPVYYGFEYFLMSADGKERLEEMRGNSKGDTKGCYDPETLEYDVKKVGRVIPELKLYTLERIKNAQKTIDSCRADIESVKNGTYNLGSYGVISWASRPDLAQKAANTYTSRTRRTTVSPIDQ